MTQKGYDVLKAFIDNFNPSHIDFVIGSKDEKVNNDYYEEIKGLCEKNNINFIDKKSETKINSSYSITVSWKWLIQDLEKVIIIHDSILPKYRGFSPLVSALINGEEEIGVTAILGNNEFDKGDVIAQKTTKIKYPIKIKDAIDIISKIYIEIVIELSRRIINNETLEGQTQDETKATYSLWRDEDDYKIDWNKDSLYIKRFVDAVSNPYLGAFCYLNNRSIRVFDVEIEDDLIIENRVPGKVLFNRFGYPTVVCGQGLVRITNARYENEKASIIPLQKFRSRFN